jgi:hypothetical protein
VIDCHADCSKAVGVQETSNCGGIRENCRGGMLMAMSTGTTRDNTSLDGIFRVSWFRRWNAQSVLSGACDRASVAKNLTFAITEADVCKNPDGHNRTPPQFGLTTCHSSRDRGSTMR